MGRSSTPSPPEEARTPSGIRAARPSRCGTRTPTQVRGGPSGPTPRRVRPGTTRPSQLRPTAPGHSFADEQARPEGPPRLPPHPRRHRGPPDRGYGLPGRSPLPPGRHRDQHRQDRARATRPAGGFHQPQRPPNHCSAPAHPDRSRNPQIPTDPQDTKAPGVGADSLPQDERGEEDDDQDAQLVDGDDHAGRAVLERPVVVEPRDTVNHPKIRDKAGSPCWIARTSRSFLIAATTTQAITRTSPAWITTPNMDSP